MKTKKALLAFAVALVTASSALAAETFVVDKGHSEAAFQVRHIVTKVRGRFTDFDGAIQVDRAKPEASSVEFTIKTASINTDNPQRDGHLKSPDFFDAEKFPTLTFKSSKIVTKGKDQYDVTGTLTLHGVSKEVTLSVSFLGFAKDPWGGERAGFETSVTLNRKDYGIVWNKALDNGGLMLGDDVVVNINIEASKKKEAASN
jgi:polyisoprenoid-binding protein YceI